MTPLGSEVVQMLLTRFELEQSWHPTLHRARGVELPPGAERGSPSSTEDPRVDGSIPSLATISTRWFETGFGHRPRTIRGHRWPTRGLSGSGWLVRLPVTAGRRTGDLETWGAGGPSGRGRRGGPAGPDIPRRVRGCDVRGRGMGAAMGRARRGGGDGRGVRLLGPSEFRSFLRRGGARAGPDEALRFLDAPWPTCPRRSRSVGSP